MPSPIEFFFDFPSGYAFFAALEIDDLAARHGREVRWQAFSLGAAFKATGALPLTHTPLKSDYTVLDWRRIAEAKGVDYRLPESHPHAGLPALRAFHWIDARDPATAVAFAKAVYRGYFSQTGLDIDDVAAVCEVARSLGVEPRQLAEGIADPAIKARVREVGEAAVARGVFGAPWTFVDGEPFWGWDRLPMIERRLAGALTTI
jgi:2-hydroxychromene-2-carboxylate isomerase